MSTGNRYRLFTEVRPFFADLLATLPEAQSEITMIYFSFVQGDWAERIAQVLKKRAAAGVRVRLMVDQVGQVVDRPKRTIDNQLLLEELQEAGAQVDLFKPDGHRLSEDNRLHAKICAIDETTAFIGGSNIGDHYTELEDFNLRVDGRLDHRLHDLYDFVRFHAKSGADLSRPDFHLSEMTAGDAHIWLTVPKQRHDIRRAMLKIILDARTEVSIRNWYFIPDAEILNGLRSQAMRGVKVRVIFSHRTRVRAIDAANRIHAHKLTQSGGEVYRYDHDFAHAKVTWNDRGEILFGSANLDKQALQDNFEFSLHFTDPQLVEKLRYHFEKDAAKSIQVDEADFGDLPLASKAFSYVCSLAAHWL
ncbi:MAG TPA: phospholipase D-like domain-containing protein [Anaerolineales bacterium]|nr:phospholipase D-like domain-containing protein [Anaerolineales bacterium]